MPSILGGGLSGLSAAFYLLQKGVPGSRIRLFEASSRYGGWIKSMQMRDGEFIFECGPRTIRPVGESGKNTLSLLEDLKLEGEIVPILKSTPAARRRMIYVNGQLHVLPSNLQGLLKKQTPFSRPLITAFTHDLFTGKSKEPLKDESIYNFAHRRFGKEIADYAISPMICGICAGNAKEISVKFLMKDLFAKEQKYGGVVRGLIGSALASEKKKSPTQKPSFLSERAKAEKWSIYSLKGGLEKLPITLAQHVQEKNVKISSDNECIGMTFGNNGVDLKFKKHTEAADSVIAALPSYKLGEILKEQHPKLSEMLSGIPYVDVGVVNVQYSSQNILREEGFGFLAAPMEKIPILGVIFDSCCFDTKPNTILTVMMGGHWFREYFGESPSESDLQATAQKYLKKILKINENPTDCRVNILRKCIPQYILGHHARVEAIRKYILDKKLPLSLCGAAYDGVGINDVILSARTAVQV